MCSPMSRGGRRPALRRPGGVSLRLEQRTTEAELIARARAGDGDAFAELVRPFEGKVYNLALRMCGNREDAFDLAQESFLKVYRSLGRFRGTATFSTWLYRIVCNTCLDQLRRQRRAGIAASLDEPVEAEDGIVHREVADRTFEPEEAVLRTEVRREVIAAVRLLPAHHRLAIILRELEGLTYEEIAARTGTSLGTVKSRISRARSAVKDHLAARELLPAAGVYSLDRGGGRSASDPAIRAGPGPAGGRADRTAQASRKGVDA